MVAPWGSLEMPPQSRHLRPVSRRALQRAAKKKAGHARLDVFSRGTVWGMHLAGMRRADMLEHLRKKDGQRVPIDAVDKIIARKKANPEWTGQAIRVARSFPC